MTVSPLGEHHTDDRQAALRPTILLACLRPWLSLSGPPGLHEGRGCSATIRGFLLVRATLAHGLVAHPRASTSPGGTTIVGITGTQVGWGKGNRHLTKANGLNHTALPPCRRSYRNGMWRASRPQGPQAASSPLPKPKPQHGERRTTPEQRSPLNRRGSAHHPPGDSTTPRGTPRDTRPTGPTAHTGPRKRIATLSRGPGWQNTSKTHPPAGFRRLLIETIGYSQQSCRKPAGDPP